jgi:diguanylate cyclase (GGDEF)-like protein
MCPPSADGGSLAELAAESLAQLSSTASVLILIVDDDPVVRSLMRDALEDEGFAVDEAEDGVEALMSCAEDVPALLVVDAVMPRMDGFALCRELRRQPATAHVPILMATGLEDHASIAKAYEAGATDFIAKPLNWLILNHRIRYMLRGAGVLDELRHNQERLRAAQRLVEEQKEHFEAALGNMSQGLAMFGADGEVIVTNRRFRDLYQLGSDSVTPGHTVAEVLGKSALFTPIVDGRQDPLLEEHLALTERRESAALTLSLPDGRVVTVTHEPMPGGGFVDTVTDVTRQHEAEARIAHMALHDPLTDLPNRVLFRQRLEEALHRVPRGEACAVLCLDLDQFKGVNDTLGHPVGDALLKAVTDRLRRIIRQTDTVARLGGDEFAIVQSSVNHPADATALATRVLRELSTPFQVAGHQVVIGTSIGIAVAPEDGTDPDVLLKSADIALYRAKSDGRNRHRYFEPAMDALMRARRELELDLRKAIRSSEFELYFQPLVNLLTQRITGFEALLRWRHPKRGIVSPGEFIPLAEEIGLIIQMGEWVLQEACRCAASWPEPVKVAVNISTVQFKGPNLISAVTQALEQSKLDPSRLELEITESVMVHDFDAALTMLRELKKLGVSISMDDFGTGYSSLSYLRAFPFDKIKIDQSFVRELGRSSDCTAIIRAVTGMCDSLGIIATAEGVETAQQLRLLQAEQCTEIQGYLVSRPRPADEIPDIIRHFRQSGRQNLFHSPVLTVEPETARELSLVAASR